MKRGWELCTLESLGAEKNGGGAWVMEWDPPPADWELPPPLSGGDLGAQVGSMEPKRAEELWENVESLCCVGEPDSAMSFC